jgi:Uma2 family endonuclease
VKSCAIALGIIFSATDSVIPDVVWASNQRLEECLDQSGHLTDAPELVVEVLSKGVKDKQRDLELKRKLYSTQGVQEYWILDYQQQQIKVYRRKQAV